MNWTQEFKEGAKDGVAMYGALFVTLFNVVLLIIVLITYQVWLCVAKLCGLKRTSYNALTESGIQCEVGMFTEGYLYWYDKITKLVNKLVK